MSMTMETTMNFEELQRLYEVQQREIEMLVEQQKSLLQSRNQHKVNLASAIANLDCERSPVWQIRKKHPKLPMRSYSQAHQGN